MAVLALLCQPVTASSESISYAPFAVPEYDSGGTWTYVTMDGGHIGLIDLDEIKNGDFSSAVALLQAHRDWTGAGDDLELAMVDVRARNVMLAQLVHGTLVDLPISIRTDEHGNVIRLTSVIVHPEAISNVPTILEEDAVAIGKEALRNYLEQSDSRVHILRNEAAQPTLYLEPPENLNGPVRFYWRMHMRALGGRDTYAVLVDAHSGDSEVNWR